MPPNAKYDWPSDDELVEVIVSEGGYAAAGRKLGIPPTSIVNRADDRGMKAKVEAGLAESHEPANREPEERQEVSHEETLEQENRELRKQLTRARKEDVREQRVIDTIERVLPSARQTYKPGKVSRSAKKAPHTLVALFSDAHAAEVVSLEETNGANEYDWDIMLARLDSYRRGILSFAERFGPVEELVIPSLGDGLSGNIHDELRETNQMPLAEATAEFGIAVGGFVEALVPEFPKIRFAGVVGNHPRSTPKMRAKGRFDNADWVSNRITAQYLARYPSVTVEVPKAQKHPLMVYGRRLLLTHGDGIRSAMVGVPWGGLVRHEARLRNQYAQMGIPIDHLLAGHFHEANAISNRRIFVNGSIKGIDEYSMEAFGGGHPPTQMILPMHPKWGIVGAQYVDLEPTPTAVGGVKGERDLELRQAAA